MSMLVEHDVQYILEHWTAVNAQITKQQQVQ